VSCHVTFAENIFPFFEHQPQDPNPSTSSSSPPRYNIFPFSQQPHPAVAAAQQAPAATAELSPAADFQPPLSSPPTPASASSAAPGAFSPLSPIPPPHAISVPLPTNDHPMHTRGKSGFRLPAKDRLNLNALYPLPPFQNPTNQLSYILIGPQP
jgi:hypothetical protein